MNSSVSESNQENQAKIDELIGLNPQSDPTGKIQQSFDQTTAEIEEEDSLPGESKNFLRKDFEEILSKINQNKSTGLKNVNDQLLKKLSSMQSKLDRKIMLLKLIRINQKRSKKSPSTKKKLETVSGPESEIEKEKHIRHKSERQNIQRRSSSLQSKTKCMRITEDDKPEQLLTSPIEGRDTEIIGTVKKGDSENLNIKALDLQKATQVQKKRVKKNKVKIDDDVGDLQNLFKKLCLQSRDALAYDTLLECKLCEGKAMKRKKGSSLKDLRQSEDIDWDFNSNTKLS